MTSEGDHAVQPLHQADPALRYVFEFVVEVGSTVRVGGGIGDELHFVPITGGTVRGTRLEGEVLPAGGDWWVRRSPTTIELDAHYLVRSAEGVVIDVRNRGYYRTPTAELMALADSGVEIDPRRLYYRTSARFQTDDSRYTWLGESIFVGLAYEDSGRVRIRFFELV